MREILFRGKRVDNGEWAYGYYVHECGNLDETAKDWIEGCPVGLYEVSPETIGQYTGLKDKNDAKIFEGDIVSMPGINDAPDLRVVAYSEYNARFIRLHNSPKSYDYVMNHGCCDQYEIIGNIHDNPELVKVDS